MLLKHSVQLVTSQIRFALRIMKLCSNTALTTVSITEWPDRPAVCRQNQRMQAATRHLTNKSNILHFRRHTPSIAVTKACSVGTSNSYLTAIKTTHCELTTAYCLTFLYLYTNSITDNKGDWNKGRALVIAPRVDTATTEALRYMARTKQRRTYLPKTFPAVAGTHLPTPKGWRVE